MLEGNSAEEASSAGSRKNSILVKNENSAMRLPAQSAHPHFVEQILPHRSPAGSVSGAPDVLGGQPSQPLGKQLTSKQPQISQQGPGDLKPVLSPMSAQQQQSQQGQQKARNAAKGVASTQDRLEQFHFGSVRQESHQSVQLQHSQTHLQQTSGGQSVPSGALLAQAQAEAQSNKAAGSSWARNASPMPVLSGAPSNPSRVTSPSAHSSEPEAAAAPLAGRATSKQPSDPRIPMDDGKIHILIGVTGSLHISSVKSIIIKLQSLYGDRVAIQVIVTPAAEKMIASSASTKEAKDSKDGKDVKDSKDGVKEAGEVKKEAHHPNLREKEPHPNLRVWHDADEWDTWRGRNDPVVHIELRRWADILLIAPMSANTLGKIAMGLCDNLLTNVVRAWNAQYPILVAPAMVAYAYNHPATKHHLKSIREEMKWIEILRPTEKVAGSTGGIGMGGMMPWNEIVDRIVQKLGGYPDDEDEDDEDEDEDEDEMRRNRAASRNDPGTDGIDDLDDDDEEDEDNDDILKDGIEGSHQGSRQGSPRSSPI